MALYVISFLKMLYSEGRPFMKSQYIYPHICELTFGSPSMEASNIFCFFFVYLLLVYDRVREGKIVLDKLWKFAILCTAIIIGVALLILVCLQGLYNGTSFTNQILIGI